MCRQGDISNFLVKVVLIGAFLEERGEGEKDGDKER